MLAVVMLSGAVVILGVGWLVKVLHHAPAEDTVSEQWLSEHRGRRDPSGGK